MKRNGKIVLVLALMLALLLVMPIGHAEEGVDLAAVLESFELSEEMMDLTIDDLVDLYYFDAADIKQCAAAMHSSGINCDEIILIEAVDEDAAGRVKQILDARYEAKLNETRNYLPDEYAIIEKCSVSQEGNFIAMIVAPNAADLVSIYEESIQQ